MISLIFKPPNIFIYLMLFSVNWKKYILYCSSVCMCLDKEEYLRVDSLLNNKQNIIWITSVKIKHSGLSHFAYELRLSHLCRQLHRGMIITIHKQVR